MKWDLDPQPFYLFDTQHPTAKAEDTSTLGFPRPPRFAVKSRVKDTQISQDL